MEIILLKRVENLGSLGDKVRVRPGYGRNYLIPTGRAIPATPSNLEAFEARRAELERDAANLFGDAEARKARLTGLAITIPRRAGDEGRLFGSVTSADIAAALTAAGHPTGKQEIRLSQGPFRATGEYDVVVHVHSGLDVTIKLHVVAEV
jgi:large subunit ribosomal protein L9